MTDYLFGQTDGEVLYRDVASLYESIECDWEPDERLDIEVCQFAAHPITVANISYDRIIDNIVEWDFEEMDDEYGQLADRLRLQADKSEVRASFTRAFEHLLEGAAGWLVADTIESVHHITHDDNGDPLYDGLPLYRKKD